MLRTRTKVITIGLTLSLVLAGCEGLFDALSDSLLETYLDSLEEGEVTVTVENVDENFDRADVWLQKIDPDELDVELEDLDDDEAVRDAVEEWLEGHDPPTSIPESFAAGYGADEINGGQVSKKVSPDFQLTDDEDYTEPIINEDDPAAIDGYVYVVFALLRNADDLSAAELGVWYAVVDGDVTVTLDYAADDPAVFEEF